MFPFSKDVLRGKEKLTDVKRLDSGGNEEPNFGGRMPKGNISGNVERGAKSVTQLSATVILSTILGRFSQKEWPTTLSDDE